MSLRQLLNTGLSKFLRQFLALFLIFTILTTQAPAAPRDITNWYSGWSSSFAFWLNFVDWSSAFSGLFNSQRRGQERKQERQEDRDLRVVRVEISPSDVTIKQNQELFFAAVAYDADNSPAKDMQSLLTYS
jgi:hypothetical protein